MQSRLLTNSIRQRFGLLVHTPIGKPVETVGESGGGGFTEVDYPLTHYLDADAGPREVANQESWGFNTLMGVEFYFQPKVTWPVGSGGPYYMCGARGTAGSNTGIRVAVYTSYNPHRIIASVYNAAGTRLDIHGQPGYNFVPGTWYHVCVVIADGVNVTENQIYINGLPITTSNQGVDMHSSRSPQAYPAWYIGGAYGVTSGCDALISIMRTWIRPRSAAEVLADWQKIILPTTYGLHTQHVLDNDDGSLCYHNPCPLTGGFGGVYANTVARPTDIVQQVYTDRMIGQSGVELVEMTLNADDCALGTYDNWGEVDSRFQSMPFDDAVAGCITVEVSGAGGNQFKIVPSNSSTWRTTRLMPDPAHVDYPFILPAWGGMMCVMKIYDTSESDNYYNCEIGVRSNNATAGNYSFRIRDDKQQMFRPYSSTGSWITLWDVLHGKVNKWANYAVGIFNADPGGYWAAGVFGDLSSYIWEGDIDTLPGAPTSTIAMLSNANTLRWRGAIGGPEPCPIWDSDGDNVWPYEYFQSARPVLCPSIQSRNSKIAYWKEIKFSHFAWTPPAP